MAMLQDVPIQPLDVILFRGMDPVSKAICFMQDKKLGRGDFSHAGMAVTREALDLPFLEPGRVYVWESTLSAKEGFWARFTDRIPDVETQGLRFGVQLRDLELVIAGYSSNGGKVAWCAYRGPRPRLEDLRRHLLDLHAEYGDAPYTVGQLKVVSVVFPAMRTVRDTLGRVRDRLVAVLSRPVVVSGTELEVAASIGMAVVGAGKSDPEALLRMADESMYRAKEERRGSSRGPA